MMNVQHTINKRSFGNKSLFLKQLFRLVVKKEFSLIAWNLMVQCSAQAIIVMGITGHHRVWILNPEGLVTTKAVMPLLVLVG